MNLTERTGIGGNMRRHAVYFFYDPDGIVDEYVLFAVRDLRANGIEVTFVSNGSLQEVSKEHVLASGSALLERPNAGMDAYAYREVILSFGKDALDSIDELLLLNYTIVGPIDSIGRVLRQMDEVSADFWGLTRHHGAAFDPWGLTEHGYIPPHLQSHFIAVRQPLLSSDDFREYWTDLPEIQTYEQSIALHEIRFEPHFNALGYRSDVFVNTDDLADACFYPLFNFPVELLEERGAQYFKRKLLTGGPSQFLGENDHNVGADLVRFLGEKQPEHLGRVVAHLMRTEGPRRFAESASLVRVLPQCAPHADFTLTNILIVLRIDNPLFVKQCASWLTDIELQNRVIVEGPIQVIKECARYLPNARTVPLGHLPVIEPTPESEFICIIDLRGMAATYPATNAASLIDSLFGNLCASQEHVSRVIEQFKLNPWVGCLTVPPAIHGPYFEKNWVRDEGVIVGAQDGGIWVRGPFRSLNWRSSLVDLTREVAQQGQATMAVLSESRAGSYITALVHALNETQRPQSGRFEHLIKRVESYAESIEYFEGRTNPQTFNVQFDLGSGFDYSTCQEYPYRKSAGDIFCADISIPSGAQAVRLDIFEEGIIAVKDLKISTRGFKARPLNSVRVGETEVFLTGDPQILIEGNFITGSEITVEFQNIGVAPIFTPNLWEMSPALLNVAALAHGSPHFQYELRELQREMERLKSSISWRLTKPLRLIRYWVNRVFGTR